MRKPNLQKLHASAHAIGQDAVSLFHTIAADLRKSADQHRAVADEAYAQILELSDLHNSAKDAADTAERQAQAVTALVTGA